MTVIQFAEKFQRGTHSGQYVFRISYATLDPPCTGVRVGGDVPIDQEELWKLPEACSQKEVGEFIVKTWFHSCKHFFSKPISFDAVMARTLTHEADPAEAVAALSPEEEENEWFLLWVPTSVVMEKQHITVRWAPTQKKLAESRIEEDFSGDTPSIQGAEESQFRVIENQPLNASDAQWIQDVSELPFSDRPALRLAVDQEASKEKLRRRVRDARLRAKLARYRAERLAMLFQERLGFYPEENGEEVQTEYEGSSDEETA